jgi:hypothetical protein
LLAELFEMEFSEKGLNLLVSGSLRLYLPLKTYYLKDGLLNDNTLVQGRVVLTLIEKDRFLCFLAYFLFLGL